jgi:hypothetical protein
VKFRIFFLLVLLIAETAPAAPKPQTAAPLTPAEQWVIDQVSNGNVASLKKRFPQENDRQLSPKFLEDLLMNALPGVETHRNGLRIDGAIITGPVDMANAQFTSEIWLDNCRFLGPAIFHHASFARSFSIDGTLFNANAEFNNIKVGGDLAIQKAVFEGPVSFYAAEVARGLEAHDAQFRDTNGDAIFNSVRAASASFNNACFEGSADFSLVNITGDFLALNAVFKNREKPASFNSVKISGSAVFHYAVFNGPVYFFAPNVTGSLQAEGAQFTNTETGAYFRTLKAGNASFKKAVFEGPVDFLAAVITGSFQAQEAQFRNKAQAVSFNSMKAGDAFFNQAVFEGGADLITLDVANDLNLTGAQFRNEESNATFNSVTAGRGFFNKTVFKGPVDLGFSQFSILEFSGTKWPAKPKSPTLTGMSYKSIRAHENNRKSHEELLLLADRAQYSVDVYGSLEAYFLHQGYKARADDAFVAGKRRERRETLHGPRLIGSYLLDGLVRYGRRPWQIGGWCAMLVGLGCFLFRPKKMEPQKPEFAERVYNPFWYSLDLFLPFVNLHSDDVWKPKQDERFIRHYLRVHILLGWILIPILLAAITGLIK